MNDRISVLPEPKIVFGDNRRLTDPHAGLSLFGPYDKNETSHPGKIAYALVGTDVGIARFQEFAAAIQGPIFHESFYGHFESLEFERLWPPFPGFSAAFESEFPKTTKYVYRIAESEIKQKVTDLDPHKRAFDVANLYLEKIRLIAERDEHIGVVICVEPDAVWANCRPKSTIREGGTGVKVSSREANLRRQYGADLFLDLPEGQYDYSVDFRRQLKARSMEYGIPLQLIRESTLVLRPQQGDRELTSLSDRAWNLAAAIYYKAGGKPWKLADARDGVCYVGLAFKQAEGAKTNRSTACCAAQMFLDTGDGVVFRGEFGPWYSEHTGEFHLKRESARFLLEGVLKAYAEQDGRELKEVFLHSRSGFNEDELKGYADACGSGIKLVGVRVGSGNRDLRMFRSGDWCVQRGTMWIHDQRTAYLWASGFKPDLLTYDGWEVPAPVQLNIQYGDADIVQVAKDILALTKLNYNACKVGDALPVTVAFSDKVGEILTSNPKIQKRYPQFKFYI